MTGHREMTAARLRSSTEPGLQACFPCVIKGSEDAFGTLLVSSGSHDLHCDLHIAGRRRERIACDC
jgi:hypothetical protein